MKKVICALMAVLMLSTMSMAQKKTINAPMTRELATKAAAMKGAKQTMSKMTKKMDIPAAKTIISTFPYLEDFESGRGDWTVIDNDHDGFTWELGATLGGIWGAHSGDECILSGSFDNDNGVALTPDNWLVSSQIQLPTTATDFVLSWYDAAQDPDYAGEHYSVYIATSNSVSAFTATTAVFTTTLTTDAWTKRSVDLSAYAGQNIYVAFRHHNCTDMFYMKLDDIRVGGPEAPTVSINVPAMAESGTVVDLSASVSGATSFQWTLNGATPATATTYDVQATWATPGTYTVVATATNSVGTASDSATIDIYYCATIDSFPYTANLAAGLGCWSNRSDSTEGTGWLPVGEIDGLDEGSVASFSAQSFMGLFMLDMPVDNWLTSPQIDVPATGEYELSWNVKPFDPNFAGDNYSVYAIVGDQTTLLYTETLSSSMTTPLSSSMTTWQHRIVSLSAYAGQSIRVAFRHHDCAGGYVILLDQISITTLSAPYVTLSAPAYAKVNQAATFTAVSGNAGSYAWTVDGTAVTETSNTLSYTFATSGTHSVQVVATNTVGSTSASATIEAIECEAIATIPYTEDFENHIICWDTISMNHANDAYFGIVAASEAGVAAHSGNNVFQFSSYADANDYNQYLITPEINITEGAVAVKFWYRGYNEADAFRVLYSTTGNQPADFTHELANFATVPTTQWTLFGISLPTEAKYVAINYYGEYQYFLYIDDFEITALSAPSATISGPAAAWVNNTVTFTANAVMADTYAWTVDGAAQSSTSNTLDVVFATAGIHNIELTVANSQGSATATATIEVKAWGDTMYYDNGNYEDAVGTGGEIYWGVKFNAADLQNRNYLTHVLFFAAENGTGNYDVRIYQGGDDAPQTLVAQQNYAVSQSMAWQDVLLNTSVQLDATKTLWVVLHTTSVEYPAASCAFDGNYNSSWASTDGVEWGSVQALSSGSIDASWMIRAVTGSVAGIDEMEMSSMALYPNPTTGRINIVADGFQMAEVMDMNGRTVMTTNSTLVDLGNMANGIYMVRVITNNGIALQKVVKK
ncbi:MAG: choice-of-anchor J domain-containing protein [Bacteroidales bacterium]|nr:choice-of-anchor J domain-containing protein [Bacteroidales bacterium]